MASTNGIRAFERAEFRTEKLIGFGPTGHVYLVDHPFNGEMAVKLLSGTKKGREVDQDALREIENIGRWNNHMNIIRFFGYVMETINNEKIITGYAMEYMADKTLHTAIHDPSISYNILGVARWGKQASLALAWLHSEGIIHRDVKPHSMLLSDGRKTLKLCDFGCTRSAQEQSMTMGIGTAIYMAPELLLPVDSGRYTRMCDVYSMGVVLWELTTRKFPFRISHQSSPPLELVPVSQLRDVISRCSSDDPTERPSMIELCDIMKSYEDIPSIPNINFVLERPANTLNLYEEMIGRIKDVEEFQFDHFTNTKFIKSGSGGSFYSVQHSQYGRIGAKIFAHLKYNEQDKDQIQEILYMVKHASHENIVRFFGCIVEYIDDQRRITGYTMELANESLSDAIHDATIKYNAVDVRRWTIQAANAIGWLHIRGIIHRDVKPDNTGTLRYMAPELFGSFERGRYLGKCDVYSMGITLWEMTTRKKPFDGLGAVALIGEVVSGERPPHNIVPVVIFRKFIRWCTHANPEKRPTMEQLEKTIAASDLSRSDDIALITRMLN